jgi:hypothetical protein
MKVLNLGMLAFALGLGIGLAAEPDLKSIPLGELEPWAASQDWGDLAVDQSVWGKPIRIGDRQFATGLGTHASSLVTYRLEGRAERFEAWVGVDAAMRSYTNGSVVFKVVADGKELFDSGVMRPETPAKRISVPLAGVQELRLAVTDGGDGITCDHADWAEAILTGRFEKPALAELPPPGLPRYPVEAAGLKLALSAEGGLVKALLNGQELRPFQGGTRLAQCTNTGPVQVRELGAGKIEFRRPIRHAVSGKRANLTEIFYPAGDSVRWEIEISSEDDPWSTSIETWLAWPASEKSRWWTAWDDPRQKGGDWQDPLVMQPLDNARLWYGAPRWDEAQASSGYQPGYGKRFAIPMFTVAEEPSDRGLSLVLSPEDTLLEMSLSIRKPGVFTFIRNDHRLGKAKPVRFAMNLVAHAADWRCGLGWMVRRYGEYFNPPNPRAHEVAGLGGYSDWEGGLDAARLRKMGFRFNWKASYDFPYMGMFLPPIPDATPYTRLAKGNQTSIGQLRDYSERMRQSGFHVLNYFNVTEFGGKTGEAKDADPKLQPPDYWKNVNNFLHRKIPDGILLSLKGRVFGSWEGSIAMDCGGPAYRAFLLDQAQRHVDLLPASSGICIDRLDWLRFYNFRADDGVTWRHDQACRSLYSSWRNLMSDLGPIFHRADKVIFVNAMINRTELLRQVDGIYHEFGHVGADLNNSALQCVRKPCVAWTPNEEVLRPDPDAYFQRHLYLGVYPTAPLPANDHTINASAWAEKWYLDYGPLFTQLRGRTWVLEPHAIGSENPQVKANVFEVPGGWLIPVTFGGQEASAVILLKNLDARLEAAPAACQAWHPGSEITVPVPFRIRDGQWRLEVPLRRGCALVRIQASP